MVLWDWWVRGCFAPLRVLCGALRTRTRAGEGGRGRTAARKRVEVAPGAGGGVENAVWHWRVGRRLRGLRTGRECVRFSSSVGGRREALSLRRSVGLPGGGSGGGRRERVEEQTSA